MFNHYFKINLYLNVLLAFLISSMDGVRIDNIINVCRNNRKRKIPALTPYPIWGVDYSLINL